MNLTLFLRFLGLFGCFHQGAGLFDSHDSVFIRLIPACTVFMGSSTVQVVVASGAHQQL